MDTVIVQLTSPRTMNLLHELEELHLLKVLKKNIDTGTILSDKYAGKLPLNIGEDLQRHIEQSRQEWDNNISLTVTPLLITLPERSLKMAWSL